MQVTPEEREPHPFPPAGCDASTARTERRFPQPGSDPLTTPPCAGVSECPGVGRRHIRIAALAAIAVVAAAAVLLAQPQPVRGGSTYDVALDGLLRNTETSEPTAAGVIRGAFRAGWEARGVLARCDAEGMDDAACADRLRQHLRRRYPR